MTEKTLRTRLRRAGWSRTDYPAVNLLITAGRTQEATIRPVYRAEGVLRDNRAMLGRALRALKLIYAEGSDGDRAEDALVRLSPRSLRLLDGLRKEAEERKFSTTR